MMPSSDRGAASPTLGDLLDEEVLERVAKRVQRHE